MRKILKRTENKIAIRWRRRRRIRNKVEGNPERPRLCVTKTNRGLSVQLIDDLKGVTLLAARTPRKSTANVESATKLGAELAAKAKEKGIEKVVFDRSGNLYHGRVAAFATGAREGGLQF